MTAADERKKRQEKFRKRTGSLFDKVEKLARDTDAFVSLVVCDRTGKARSFRASDRPYWPHSIKELIEQHPTGSHKYLQKRAIFGGWEVVEGDESDSDLVGEDKELAVENIRAVKVASAERETVSDSTITVDVCHEDKEVKVSANAQIIKAIETVESRETIVDALRSENKVVVVSGESENTAVTVPGELHYIVDVLTPLNDAGVDSLTEPYNATLDADGEQVDTIAELWKSDNVTVEAADESNNKTLDTVAESDRVVDVFEKSRATDVLNAEKVDPTTFDYDTMDIDTGEGKNHDEANDIEMFGVGDSIEAAVTLHEMSQHRTSPSLVNLNSWQVVDWPGTAFQDDRERQDSASSKLLMGIDQKDLLRGWDWIFQKM